MTVDKIFLVGFMAAGKTTVARILAGRLGWRFEDIDSLIEARERKPIAEIFRSQGEPHFRSVERDIVQLVVPLRHVVVATGGGTFADPENRAAMTQDGVCVWLDVPLDELVARLPSDGRRPLAADRTQMERLYATRQLAYAHAHIRIDGRSLTSGEAADRILDGVRAFERHPL